MPDGLHAPIKLRFLTGPKDFFDQYATRDCCGFIGSGGLIRRGAAADSQETLKDPELFAWSTWPRVVFIPSDTRDLIVPNVKSKAGCRARPAWRSAS